MENIKFGCELRVLEKVGRRHKLSSLHNFLRKVSHLDIWFPCVQTILMECASFGTVFIVSRMLTKPTL